MTSNHETGEEAERARPARKAALDGPLSLRDRLGDALMSRLYEMCRIVRIGGRGLPERDPPRQASFLTSDCSRTAQRQARPIMSSEPFENVLYEVRDGAAWITVNRPDKLNALEPQERSRRSLPPADSAAGRLRRLRHRAHRRRTQGLRGRRRHRRDVGDERSPGRGLLPLSCNRAWTALNVRRSRSSPRSTVSRSAVVVSWRWPATSASPRRPRNSGNPR